MKKTKKNCGEIFVISAPSGAGKTTLTYAVIERLKNTIDISKVITYTSRTPRPNEVAEKDYVFVSREEFLEKKKHNFFLETTEYNGEHYGSPAHIKEEIKRGESFILVIDLVGVHSVIKLLENPVLIWITPPSLSVLEERLSKRGETKEKIKERLALAEQELQEEKEKRAQEKQAI